MTVPSRDAQLDARALVRVFIDGDRRDLRVILDHADLREVAIDLAAMASIWLAKALGDDERAVEYLTSTQRQIAQAAS